MKHWKSDKVDCRSIGKFQKWSIRAVQKWHIEMLEHRKSAKEKHWNFGT
ncbi:hypothetical protein [Clostridium intestinale]|nr:hypothetical protein [Clostridium intestinale]